MSLLSVFSVVGSIGRTLALIPSAISLFQKPIGKAINNEELEVLQTWLMFQDEEELVGPYLTENSVHLKRQSFECLVSFYRKGREYGYILFLDCPQSPQNNADLILPRLLADTAKEMDMNELLFKLLMKILVKRNRVFITEASWLSGNSNVGFTSSWDPSSLFHHEYQTASTTESDRLIAKVRSYEVSIKVLQDLDAGLNPRIPVQLAETILSRNQPADREKMKIKYIESRKLLENYVQKGWKFLRS